MAEQLKPHTARAADDFTNIRQRIIALRLERDGKCAIREGWVEHGLLVLPGWP
jgi:hypothetical protein